MSDSEKMEVKIPKFIEHTIRNKRLNKVNFFYLLDKLDWSKQGDDEAVLRPLVNYLAECDDIVIFAFHDKMAEMLYALDTREIAQRIYGDVDYISADDFLYSRCVGIINGSHYYDRIIWGSDTINPDLWFESVLYVPNLAWAKKHDKDSDEYPHLSKVSYESYSNVEGWKIR